MLDKGEKMTGPFYQGDRVRIQNVASIWNRRLGTVVSWICDYWYDVLVDDTNIKLALDASRNEIILEEKEL
jgi:hypothetical protein